MTGSAPRAMIACCDRTNGRIGFQFPTLLPQTASSKIPSTRPTAKLTYRDRPKDPGRINRRPLAGNDTVVFVNFRSRQRESILSVEGKNWESTPSHGGPHSPNNLSCCD